jgi:hypothetical protein
MKPWIRPALPADRSISRRTARIELVALLTGPRVDGAIERAREEVPDEAAWEPLEVTVRSRTTDGGWLDGQLAGRAGLGLGARDEHDRREVDRCRRYATVEATLPDPATLDALQAALVLLVALAQEGDLLLAVDGATGRWWSPGELMALDPERPFDLDEHVRVVVEAVERAPGVGHLARSRGLAKFARPDVAARGPRKDAERLGDLLRDLARLLAAGEVLCPGDRVRAPDLPPLTLVPRSDDALVAAPPDEAPLYELVDLAADGRPGPDCRGLLAALRPRARLNVVR